MKLKLADAAKCLNLPESTIERWIRQGRIPMRKKEDICFFKKDMLARWASAHKLIFTLNVVMEAADNAQGPLEEELVAVMKRGGVLHDIKGSDVQSVLASAVSRMTHLEETVKAEFLAGLIERERLSSTGIGNGVSIPHPRTPISQMHTGSAITTCFLEKPIDFNAIDNRPVFVLFIFLSASVKRHLHLLSRLSFCVRDHTFISFLKTMPSQESLLSKISEMETSLQKGQL